jgi:hypothetical protein
MLLVDQFGGQHRVDDVLDQLPGESRAWLISGACWVLISTVWMRWGLP